MQSCHLNVPVLIFVLILHLYCFSNQGHNKNILSVASSEDGSTLYTGSFDSRICILSSIVLCIHKTCEILGVLQASSTCMSFCVERY